MVEQDRVILSSALAQKVLDTLGATVAHSVNVMNEHGTIIASTNPARVGTHHAASLEAMGQARTVSVHDAAPEAGTLPGVNTPLRLRGRICGAIGVSGPPEEVKPLADLIGLTVQLLINQEQAMDRTKRKELVARDTVSALLAGTLDAPTLRRRLDELGLPAPWHLALSVPEPKPGTKRHALGVVVAADHIRVELQGAHWVLGGGPAPGDRTSSLSGRSVRLAARTDCALLLGDAENLQLLARRPMLLPKSGPTATWNLDCALAAARIPHRTLPVSAHRAGELNQDQFATVAALAASSTVGAACGLLHVHRNTLIQRIERIRELSGLDPRNPGDLFGLLLGCHARVVLGELHMP